MTKMTTFWAVPAHTTETSFPGWAWIVVVLLVIVAAALFYNTRRRK